MLMPEMRSKRQAHMTYGGIIQVQSALQEGVGLAKCQKCGCMSDALAILADQLPAIGAVETDSLAARVSEWSMQMQPVQFACLGCATCYAALAQNAFADAFPTTMQSGAAQCDFQVRPAGWPGVLGEYFVIDPGAPVAVSTLGSVALAVELAKLKPAGLAIVGKTETENIGIDKVVRNIVTNKAIHFLVVAGNEPAGHLSGRTILALAHNGIDLEGRVVGSPGKKPILRNVASMEIEAFRSQVRVIDMIGCERVEEIAACVESLVSSHVVACGCGNCAEDSMMLPAALAPRIIVADPTETAVMDPAGYFVVLPLPDKQIISVEHYAYDNRLLRVIEGGNARSIYAKVIANGWVSELSHAAYLGRELAKAELSIQYGIPYVQDGA
jgi:tetrahydromethanopterin S-methyltransferase subunit A